MIRADFEPEVGDMDPRLADALNAFGSSRYDESRKLAEDLISASDESSTRAECVGIIILSHLDQGDFAGAREAADRLRSVSPDVCQDLLVQVNREELDYRVEVSRLQQIVVTATNPEQAARAQLRTARVHQVCGRLELAEKSYRKVVDSYPTSPSAALAVRRAAAVALMRGDFEAAKAIYREAMEQHPGLVSQADGLERIADVEVRSGHIEQAVKSYWGAIWAAPDSPSASERVLTMERLAWRGLTPGYARELGKAVAEQAPNSDLATAACQQLFDLASADGKVQCSDTRATFDKIASTHPDTQAADSARYLLGKLYAAEGQYDAAEEAWASLIAERPKARVAADARVGLADLRYTMGTRAFFQRDYAQAARSLERLLPDLDFLGERGASGRLLLDESHPTVASKPRLALFSLGEAYQKLGRWDQAADVFARLAVPGNPAEEVALFQLGRSKMEAGYHADALDAFTKLKNGFPQSAYIAQCEDYLRAIPGGR